MSYAWATNLLYLVTGTEPPPQAGLRNSSAREAPPSQARHNRKETGGKSLADAKSLDQLIAIAKRRTPGWQSITFRLPERADRLITFAVDEGNGGQPQKRSQLLLNRTTGELERQDGFAAYDLGRKLRTIARFLHTGEILGIGGQLVATIASLGGAFLGRTGFALALRRLAGPYGRKARAIAVRTQNQQMQESHSN